MSEMLDEINYAIMRAFFSRPVEEQIFNASSADNEDLAKAAIEAMRVPTDKVLNAGAMIMPDYDPGNDDMLRCWQACIDEMLKPV